MVKRIRLLSPESELQVALWVAEWCLDLMANTQPHIQKPNFDGFFWKRTAKNQGFYMITASVMKELKTQ